MLIYLDNAATTRVDPEVADVARACFLEDYGNPSSLHRQGGAAAARIARAREEVLLAVGDEGGAAGDLVWTSGGTEADALAVLGAARARARSGRHVVIGALEHPAVAAAAQLLEAEGYEVTAVAAPGGRLDPTAVVAAVTPATGVVACMLVQNELGLVQPVAEIARLVHQAQPRVHVHTDAVQALGKIPIDVRALGVDSAAFSAHKLHGPKGAGALWLKKGARLQPLFGGGGQQGGLRSGTENVPGIAAFGAAARLAVSALPAAGVAALRDQLVATVAAAGLARLLGEGPRVPQIAALAFPGVPGEPLLHALEDRGVLVSAGAACSSRARHASPALVAAGVRDEGVLRVSLSRATTAEEIAVAAEAIVAAARELRISR